ncbi:MAG TPA: hypothetical protein VEK07_15715 [Polyangiaceae bacterium]|nr:hypothetical protein [Polyangiaceae bacterium]
MRFGCWPFFYLAATIVSCAAPVSSSDAPGDAETTTTSAIILVERSVDLAGGPRAEASARFVRVASTSSPEEALRAIGATIDLPAGGTCAPIAALSGTIAPEDPPPFVELLDVGEVALETSGGAETRLVPRQLPDVTDIVSGVVYARATDPGALPVDSRYWLHIGGGASLPTFEATAVAPAAPLDVRVLGEDSGGAVVTGDDSVQLAWSTLPVTDTIYVDIQPTGVRCVPQDDDRGEPRHGRLPGSLLSESGLLVIHRLHREPLHASGLDSGEIRFDFARSLAYRRR